MIRLWKGLEMEGPVIGIRTLFVCSDCELKSNKIIQILEANPDIKRIYFGAGRLPFYGVDNWQQLCNQLLMSGINKITIEVNASQLLEFIDKYDAINVSFVCTWYDFPQFDGQIHFKLDDTQTVGIFSLNTVTALDTLGKNNLFATDKLLYEEE